ncbi:hypothetical protein CCHR01_01307 [Colletotrichum chrysophilum]|uniref:Uncharacterized protein n=1 Tax=Colletotrichum chrysophilum TaxID=1836956 RepID=A0AAD9AXY9_9PEZI|nr:hypothetical protein CCHR01_01307 [Colletotrichum chrysophilum]
MPHPLQCTTPPPTNRMRCSWEAFPRSQAKHPNHAQHPASQKTRYAQSLARVDSFGWPTTATAHPPQQVPPWNEPLPPNHPPCRSSATAALAPDLGRLFPPSLHQRSPPLRQSFKARKEPSPPAISIGGLKTSKRITRLGCQCPSQISQMASSEKSKEKRKPNPGIHSLFFTD